jgi:hypothetical protein
VNGAAVLAPVVEPSQVEDALPPLPRGIFAADQAWFADHPHRRFRRHGSWIIRRRDDHHPNVFLRVFTPGSVHQETETESELATAWFAAAWLGAPSVVVRKAARKVVKKGRL